MFVFKPLQRLPLRDRFEFGYKVKEVYHPIFELVVAQESEGKWRWGIQTPTQPREVVARSHYTFRSHTEATMDVKKAALGIMERESAFLMEYYHDV